MGEPDSLKDAERRYSALGSILGLDKSIRFCAIVDSLGHIVYSKARKDLKPLLTEQEFERYALLAAIRHRTRTVLEEKLGRADCSATYYEKVILAAIPLGDHSLLIMSVDTSVKNFQQVMYKVRGWIARYNNKSAIT